MAEGADASADGERREHDQKVLDRQRTAPPPEEWDVGHRPGYVLNREDCVGVAAYAMAYT